MKYSSTPGGGGRSLIRWRSAGVGGKDLRQHALASHRPTAAIESGCPTVPALGFMAASDVEAAKAEVDRAFGEVCRSVKCKPVCVCVCMCAIRYVSCVALIHICL